MPWKLQKSGAKYFVVDDEGKKYSEKPAPKWRALAQMRALYAGEKKEDQKALPLGEKSFRVFKQADGNYRWVTISSSAFRDRDGEIVTKEALEKAVERMDQRGDHGPLRWWHVGAWEFPDGPENWETWKAGKGVDLGICDFSMVHGKMLVESGTFKDAVTGEAFSEAAKNLEVSIAFSHPGDQPNQRKEYQDINIFERSPLPEGMASNLVTKMSVHKGDETMKAAQKLQALAAILRDKPDVVKQILADAESVEKAAETAGLEYKELAAMIEGGDATPETETPAEEVIPTPEPPAEPVAEKQAETEEPEAEVEEEDVIGDMSRDDLLGLIRQVVSEAISASVAKKEGQDAAASQLMSDLASAQRALIDRIVSVETAAQTTQQSLLELADARPVGVKQMQTLRATERTDNVVKKAPTGPTIDPDFLRFATGGK